MKRFGKFALHDFLIRKYEVKILKNEPNSMTMAIKSMFTGISCIA
ncbi:hypothetical protein FB2170_14238 [Maribacter sp. HTCC2170]|nr:hypothetical protein FB2170_14238 [Maribacter sp. HTCC2170]